MQHVPSEKSMLNGFSKSIKRVVRFHLLPSVIRVTTKASHHHHHHHPPVPLHLIFRIFSLNERKDFRSNFDFAMLLLVRQWGPVLWEILWTESW
jgi:hypothetical protein